MDGYVRATLRDIEYVYSYTSSPNKAWKWESEGGLRANTVFLENSAHKIVSMSEEELEMYRLHEE